MKVDLNITAILVVLILVLAGFGGLYWYQGQKSASTISSNGNAQMQVMPDEVSVSLQIQTKDLSAEVAKNENARISKNVMDALLALGIAKADIETQNYNIYPEYDWSDGTQKLIGYSASNSINVKTKNFDLVGKIVDSSVNAGALVNNINFELSNQKSNEYKTLVLANATQDAKVKAEAIAAGLGKTLGSLVSVSASDYNYMPYPLFARAEGGMASDAMKVATDIQPRNIDVSASATVIYKLK